MSYIHNQYIFILEVMVFCPQSEYWDWLYANTGHTPLSNSATKNTKFAYELAYTHLVTYINNKKKPNT